MLSRRPPGTTRSPSTSSRSTMRWSMCWRRGLARHSASASRNICRPPELKIAVGDTVSVVIWEAAANGLFGNSLPELPLRRGRPADGQRKRGVAFEPDRAFGSNVEPPPFAAPDTARRPRLRRRRRRAGTDRFAPATGRDHRAGPSRRPDRPPRNSDPRSARRPRWDDHDPLCRAGRRRRPDRDRAGAPDRGFARPDRDRPASARHRAARRRQRGERGRRCNPGGARSALARRHAPVGRDRGGRRRHDAGARDIRPPVARRRDGNGAASGPGRPSGPEYLCPARRRVDPVARAANPQRVRRGRQERADHLRHRAAVVGRGAREGAAACSISAPIRARSSSCATSRPSWCTRWVSRSAARAPAGLSPVVYRLDLSDAKSYLLAKRFPVKDRDIIFVAEAKAVPITRALQALSLITGPVTTGC